MKIKFISIEQLLEMKENGEKFKLVDVLSPESYEEGHIPGAVNIPLGKLEKEAKTLNKNDVIVVYCASYACHASTLAFKILFDLGFKNVLDFKAGKKGWEDAGLEFE